MKPIATVPRALRTVDVATGEEAVAHHQRSDVCAVPAAGIVAEAMVALVLADAVLEKFGGDSVGRDPPQRGELPVHAEVPVSGARHHRAPRRPGRPDGRRQDHGRRRCSRRPGTSSSATPTTTSRPSTGGASPTSSSTTGEEHFRELERAAVERALRDHPGVLALGGGAVLDPGTRERAAPATGWSSCASASPTRSSGSGLGIGRPLLLGNVRAQIKALLDERPPSTSGRRP